LHGPHSYFLLYGRHGWLGLELVLLIWLGRGIGWHGLLSRIGYQPFDVPEPIGGFGWREWRRGRLGRWPRWPQREVQAGQNQRRGPDKIERGAEWSGNDERHNKQPNRWIKRPNTAM
jgi:hypothetical protein